MWLTTCSGKMASRCSVTKWSSVDSPVLQIGRFAFLNGVPTDAGSEILSAASHDQYRNEMRFAVTGAFAKIVTVAASAGTIKNTSGGNSKKLWRRVQLAYLRASLGCWPSGRRNNHRRTKMPKYLFIQRSTPRTTQQKPQPPSPAQMQAISCTSFLPCHGRSCGFPRSPSKF